MNSIKAYLKRSGFNDTGVKWIMTYLFRKEPKLKLAPLKANTIRLYQFDRGILIPSVSPFVIKLETFLRMAQIPYDNNYDSIPSCKGKIPWIQVNNEIIADSSMCIEYLVDVYKVKIDQALSEQQKAICRLLTKTAEENTFWATIIQSRIRDASQEFADAIHANLFVKTIGMWYFKSKIIRDMRGQGIGRHSAEEVHRIGEADLRAFSSILGNKEFFMGKQARIIDATMFGLLSNIRYAMPRQSPSNLLVTKELKNLDIFVERMKEAYWPDWDDIITQEKLRLNIKH